MTHWWSILWSLKSELCKASFGLGYTYQIIIYVYILYIWYIYISKTQYIYIYIANISWIYHEYITNISQIYHKHIIMQINIWSDSKLRRSSRCIWCQVRGRMTEAARHRLLACGTGLCMQPGARWSFLMSWFRESNASSFDLMMVSWLPPKKVNASAVYDTLWPPQTVKQLGCKCPGNPSSPWWSVSFPTASSVEMANGRYVGCRTGRTVENDKDQHQWILEAPSSTSNFDEFWRPVEDRQWQ